jgi:hypothetical protein
MATVIQQPEQFRPSKAGPNLIFDISRRNPKTMCNGQGIQRHAGAGCVLFRSRRA